KEHRLLRHLARTVRARACLRQISAQVEVVKKKEIVFPVSGFMPVRRRGREMLGQDADIKRMFNLAAAIDKAVAESAPGTNMAETVTVMASIVAYLISEAEDPERAFEAFFISVRGMLSAMLVGSIEAGN